MFSVFRRIFIAFTIILTRFFFFFFRKMLIPFASLFSLFVIFFFRKILITFTCLFSKPLFVFLFFLIIFSKHFHIKNKNYKKCFLSFFVYFKRVTLRYELFKLCELCKSYDILQYSFCLYHHYFDIRYPSEHLPAQS